MKHKGRQFRTVVNYEFAGYLRNKVYVGITITLVVLLFIGLSVPALIRLAGSLGVAAPSPSDPDDPAQVIHVLDQTGQLGSLDFLQAALPAERWQLDPAASLDAVRQQIRDGQAKAALLIERPNQYTYIVKRAGMDTLAGSLQSILAAYFRTVSLQKAGLDQVAIAAILAEPQMKQVETVEESGKTMAQTYFYTYLLLFLLYMTVMMYGQLVASSVASEKSNRAMEMLITSADPLSLMFGKVIGSGLAGLAQIGVLLLAAAGAYKINEGSWSDIPFIRTIFQMPPHIVFYTVLFYLTGYFMYAFLYGALGSLASRTEDINTSIMPLILLIMAAMFTSMFGMITPDAAWLRVLSFVPFFSPMAMFVRLCMTDVPLGQVVLSVVIMLLTIAGTGWLASRIYRLGVLMYGKPPRLGELVSICKETTCSMNSAKKCPDKSFFCGKEQLVSLQRLRMLKQAS